MTHYPPPPPAKQRGRGLAVLGIAIAVLLVIGLVVGAYVFGSKSRDAEVKSAENKIADLQGSLDEAETALEDTKVTLEGTQDDLDDAEAQIAACDIAKARRVFNDTRGAYLALLNQYSDYLDNDELVFIVDWDAVERRGHGWRYNGHNTYPKQFDAAVASCGDGPGVNS